LDEGGFGCCPLGGDAVCCPDKVGNQEGKKIQKINVNKNEKKTLAQDAVCCLDKVKTGIEY